LPQLRRLDLFGTSVTRQGAQGLREMLPQLKVRRWPDDSDW
jgi:hypothetical protein